MKKQQLIELIVNILILMNPLFNTVSGDDWFDKFSQSFTLTEASSSTGTKKYGDTCDSETEPKKPDECLLATLTVQTDLTVLNEHRTGLLKCGSNKTCECVTIFGTVVPMKLNKNDAFLTCVQSGLKENMTCVDQRECADRHHCYPYVGKADGDGMIPYTSVLVCTDAAKILCPINQFIVIFFISIVMYVF